MIAPRQRPDMPSMIRQPVSLANRAHVVDFLAHRRIESRGTPDRKLRNRIVLANALVWILILFVLGMLMF
jgi:hypothetical protein